MRSMFLAWRAYNTQKPRNKGNGATQNSKKKICQKEGGKNDTLSWKYTNLDEKCNFAFTIQLVSSDIAKFPLQKNPGRWILKV